MYLTFLIAFMTIISFLLEKKKQDIYYGHYY